MAISPELALALENLARELPRAILHNRIPNIRALFANVTVESSDDTVEGIAIFKGTDDPTTGAGIAGTPGDMYKRDAPGADGGELWIKTGDGDTEWEQVVVGVAGDNLGNHTLTQDLQLNSFGLINDVSDGASAVGLDFDTSNKLSTDGSRVMKVSNNNVEHFNVRNGTDLYFGTGVMTEWFDPSGNLAMQFTSNGPGFRGFLTEGGTAFNIDMVNDFDFPAGYEYLSLAYQLGSQPLLTWFAEKQGSGFSTAIMNGIGSIQLRAGGGTIDSQFFLVTTPGGSSFNGLGPPVQVRAQIGSGLAAHRWGIGANGEMVGGSNPVSNQYRNWELISAAVNNAASTAFLMRSNNNLSTAGAKLLSLQNVTTEQFAIDKDGNLSIQGVQILTTQQGAISDASGGSTVDAEARTAINSLLAACRAHGIIAT